MTISEKLTQFASPTPSHWREDAKYRRENRYWIRRSKRISILVLSKLDELGMTQKELAQRLEFTPEEVSELVKGHKNHTLATICKLEDILGLSLLSKILEK